MPHYNVVIETHRTSEAPLYRADVVDAPTSGMLGTFAGIGTTAELAFADAKAHLLRNFKRYALDFMHVPHTGE